jgi:hypothetical protein
MVPQPGYDRTGVNPDAGYGLAWGRRRNGITGGDDIMVVFRA